MAEDKIVWFGVMPAFAQAIEVSLAAGLADHHARTCLAADIERDPLSMLILICIDVTPLERAGLAFSHARVGHDQDVVTQKFSISFDPGIIRLLDPLAHEQPELAVFIGGECGALIDLVLLMLEQGYDVGRNYPKILSVQENAA